MRRYCRFKKKVCMHYSSLVEASMVMLKIRREHRNPCDKVPLRAYKCNCGSWHLTKHEINMNGRIL